MLKRLDDILLKLPQSGSGESVKAEAFTTDWLVNASDSVKSQWRDSLLVLMKQLFPRMDETEQQAYVRKYFELPGDDFIRQGMMVRDDRGRIVASMLFDYGRFGFNNRSFTGIYSILRVVDKQYQQSGIGKTLSAHVLMTLQPDILLANTYQSASLNAWANLVANGLVTGYQVYPRLEKTPKEHRLVTVPFDKLEFVVSAFRQTYSRMVHQDLVERELKHMTLFLVRKDNHPPVFDFNPWQANGRKDHLAEAMEVNERDGIMVVFLKQDL